MSDEKPTWFQDSNDAIAGRVSALVGAQTTQTIDISTVIPVDLTVSGSFDLRTIRISTFGKLLHALSVPTLLISHSQVIEFANQAFLKVAKGAPTPVGLRFSSLFYGQKERSEAEQILASVFAQRKPAVKEARLSIHKTMLWGRLHLRTLRLGTDRMVLAQIENLTAQKELQAIKKYRNLVEVFPVGIAEFSLRWALACSLPTEQLLDGILHARLIDGNAEFAKLYKKEGIEDLDGVSLGKLLPAEKELKAFYENWIQNNFKIRSCETKEKSSPGKVKVFENTLVSNVTDNAIFGVWLLKRDITEKKRTEQEILKAQKLESLGVLAGGIAHDFNNLLTGILGNVSMVQTNSDLDFIASERLQEACKAVGRAQNLTQQLLTFSKGGAPIKTSASVAELLRDSTRFVLRGSNVRCQFSLPSDLWPVEMDAGQISQVIENLTINSVQAMPQGGTVFVHARNTHVRAGGGLPLKEGKYVRVSIADQGSGIPKKDLPRIFDPYFTTKEKGTGLGLATSYSIVKRHGGLLAVRSRLGVGTIVSFFLPCASRSATMTEADKYSRVIKGTGRILIMDDDTLIIDLAGELLSSLGYEVTLTKDGAEALTIYKNAKNQGRPFDLVILDLTVPGGMGGRPTLSKLLAFDPDVRAIASSGYSDDPIMSDPVRFGFKAVLPKPYDVKQLSRVVHAVLRAAQKGQLPD